MGFTKFRLKKCALDDVESLRDECVTVVLAFRLAKGTIRGAISEMKKMS